VYFVSKADRQVCDGGSLIRAWMCDQDVSCVFIHVSCVMCFHSCVVCLVFSFMCRVLCVFREQSRAPNVFCVVINVQVQVSVTNVFSFICFHSCVMKQDT